MRAAATRLLLFASGRRWRTCTAGHSNSQPPDRCSRSSTACPHNTAPPAAASYPPAPEGIFRVDSLDSEPPPERGFCILDLYCCCSCKSAFRGRFQRFTGVSQQNGARQVCLQLRMRPVCKYHHFPVSTW